MLVVHNVFAQALQVLLCIKLYCVKLIQNYLKACIVQVTLSMVMTQSNCDENLM